MGFIGPANELGGRLEDRLRALPTMFTSKTAREVGLSWEDLYRLRDQQIIVELSRGLYRRASAGPPTMPDLLAVSARAPRGMICLVSALGYWDLTDEMPGVVDLAVPRGTNQPTITYPPTKVHVFQAATFDLGRTQVPVGPEEHIWVSDRERTIVDCFRPRTGVGTSISYNALRSYMASPEAKPGRLLDLARALRTFAVVRHALEVLS
jgi:predicted transcriptional regulator of viral defense system